MISFPKMVKSSICYKPPFLIEIQHLSFLFILSSAGWSIHGETKWRLDP